MLNNLSCYLKKEDYRISILPYGVHILKYTILLDIKSDLALLKINNKIVKIKGTNIHLNALDKEELLITGNIRSVEINEY